MNWYIRIFKDANNFEYNFVGNVFLTFIGLTFLISLILFLIGQNPILPVSVLFLCVFFLRSGLFNELISTKSCRRMGKNEDF